jgi:hypothetical protein
VQRFAPARLGEVARCVAFVIAVAILVVFVENLAISAYFPHLSRVNTDFSPAYLQRELETISSAPPQVVFIGDSVLWGFALKPQQTAIGILASRHCDCLNLSFKASSPPNYYALVRLLQQYHVRPKLVVLEANQSVLTKANKAYATLHPALAALAGPLLSADDRKTLGLQTSGSDFTRGLDKLLSSLWEPYAFRADLRETLDPTPDALPAQPPTADTFYAEYDLTPLDDTNVGVHYLEETVDALHAARIPVLAIMTPTNHELLHEYIDGPEYRANVTYLTRLFEARGARVLNLDRAFPASSFYDSAHLKPAAQVRLAQILQREISR